MPLILPAETLGPINARFDAEKVIPSQMSKAEAIELSKEARKAFYRLVRDIRKQVVKNNTLRVFSTTIVSGGRWIDELPEMIEKYAYQPKSTKFAHVPDHSEKISLIPVGSKQIDPFEYGRYELKVMMTYSIICCDPRQLQ